MIVGDDEGHVEVDVLVFNETVLEGEIVERVAVDFHCDS